MRVQVGAVDEASPPVQWLGMLRWKVEGRRERTYGMPACSWQWRPPVELASPEEECSSLCSWECSPSPEEWKASMRIWTSSPAELTQ